MKLALPDWRTGRIAETPLILLALALPLAAVAGSEGVTLAIRLCVLAAVALGWIFVFARLRGRPMRADGLVTAALLALLLPAETPFWHLVLGATFGVVLAEEIFGGRGRGFVHPAVAALAFLAFSFAAPDYRQDPGVPTLAVLPALVLLVLAGQASWRLLLAAAATFTLVLLAQGGVDPARLSGSVLLVLLFLGADPVASGATQAGRWLHGVLLGLLTALFTQAGPLFGSALFAVLMASIFAPTLDAVVVALHMRWREARHVR
ncbi:RnfABCDGE type electron transport complex subunit D [Aureimonas altamirensis]|uniref:RnfABCDGE type electron transport complex subunit D n=1 Tax=Aureimonas altamirensis TaxID=370622 RepID=UPI001E283445|nr:RnfABCDGE type electron transport complex subunit D [Aureimonas altamirensis]UHD46473.1 RnfABCDGE type electron transport complex subunit D [Aureimonas altamirensis]